MNSKIKGVEHLNKNELSGVNGGSILLGLFISAIIDAIDNPAEFIAAMEEGANAVDSLQKK
jgi:hypothetical protein